MEQKFKDLVNEIVWSEIEQYSWFSEHSNIGFQDCKGHLEYYVLNVGTPKMSEVNGVRIKTDGISVWVELGEDWHELVEYGYSMRFLWMAMLNWYD